MKIITGTILTVVLGILSAAIYDFINVSDDNKNKQTIEGERSIGNIMDIGKHTESSNEMIIKGNDNKENKMIIR